MTMRLEISDHALVRFLERAGGLDVEEVCDAIASSLERARATAEAIKADNYTIVADGLSYVVRRGVVVTVIDGRPNRNGGGR
jgi:hypothetical protein